MIPTMAGKHAFAKNKYIIYVLALVTGKKPTNIQVAEFLTKNNSLFFHPINFLKKS